MAAMLLSAALVAEARGLKPRSRCCQVNRHMVLKPNCSCPPGYTMWRENPYHYMCISLSTCPKVARVACRTGQVHAKHWFTHGSMRCFRWVCKRGLPCPAVGRKPICRPDRTARLGRYPWGGKMCLMYRCVPNAGCPKLVKPTCPRNTLPRLEKIYYQGRSCPAYRCRKQKCPPSTYFKPSCRPGYKVVASYYTYMGVKCPKLQCKPLAKCPPPVKKACGAGRKPTLDWYSFHGLRCRQWYCRRVTCPRPSIPACRGGYRRVARKYKYYGLSCTKYECLPDCPSMKPSCRPGHVPYKRWMSWYGKRCLVWACKKGGCPSFSLPKCGAGRYIRWRKTRINGLWCRKPECSKPSCPTPGMPRCPRGKRLRKQWYSFSGIQCYKLVCK